MDISENEKEKSKLVEHLQNLEEKLKKMMDQKGADKSEMDALHK